MATMQEVAAVPIAEKFRRDSFVIMTAKHQRSGQTPASFSLLGDAEPDEFQPQVAYRFWGSWDHKGQYGPSFRFNSFAPTTPHGRAGVVAYLQQCRHIGLATAETLFEVLGPDAVAILRENPEEGTIAVGPRFSVEKAREAAEDLRRLQAAEDLTIELYDIFHGRGFGKRCVRQALDLWGADAIRALKEEPYIAMELSGVGFTKADRFYLDLGKDPSAIERQGYCLQYHTLKQADAQGHIWVPAAKSIEQLRTSIAGADVRPEEAIEFCLGEKLLARRSDLLGNLWVADHGKAAAERFVADRLVTAFYNSQHGTTVREWEERERVVTVKEDHTRCSRCHRRLTSETVAVLDGHPFGPDCVRKVDVEERHVEVSLREWLDGHARREIVRKIVSVNTGDKILSTVTWPSLSEPEFDALTPHQREQLGQALSGPISILGGRPGTGKSFTLVRLVKAMIRLVGAKNVAVMAPTGKAAQRVRELMTEAKISTEKDTGVCPSTIHRGLGAGKADGTWQFAYNEQNPLPHKFLIIEESSMVGLPLLRSLMAAVAKGTGVLFVGDVNQLPPVEPGAPLRDMIAAGLPYGELKQIHRNAGTIVRVCSAVIDKRMWGSDDKLDLQAEHPANLVLVPAGKSLAQQKLLNTLQMIGTELPFNPMWDVQVICAVNKKSPLSRKILNPILQNMLNPEGMAVRGSPFRTGDKVIQLKNDHLPIAVERMNFKAGVTEWKTDDEKTLVSNGEIGRVIHVEERKTVVRFIGQEKPVLIFRAPTKDRDDDGDEQPQSEESEDTGTGCDLDLAYAVTCHKLQGSQAPVVIVCLDEYPGAIGEYGVCDQAWFYTAISRAQKACFLIGQRHVADIMCRRTFIDRRKTFLVETITDFAKKANVALPHRAKIEVPDLW